jgi:cold shock CspA family protein
MRVELYSPERMYGFAELGDERVFFHLESFMAGVWPGIEEPPAPIVGEEVSVEYTPNPPGTDPNRAPRARGVERVHPPKFLRGVVESFNGEKGWGFARGSDGVSYFLHRSEVLEGRLPLRGQEVTFYAGFKKGRPRACYVLVGKLIG